MTAVITTCRTCGAEFSPDRTAVLRGRWRTCPTCRPQPDRAESASVTRCTSCDRELRAGGRTLCATCLGLSF
jgi:hypothetical protein